MRFTPVKKKKFVTFNAGRFWFVQGLFVFVAVVMLGRAVHLHIFEGGFLRGEGQKRFLRAETLPANRGMILDRNGKALAVSTSTLSLWANPQQLMLASERWPELATAIQISEAKLRDRLHKYRLKEFMYLKRQMMPEKAEAILSQSIPGVYGSTEYRRFYPAGAIASHLVGFTNIDERGQEGMELAHDTHLQGKEGKKLVVKDLRGNTVKDLGIQQAASDGKDLNLSIDLRIQYSAHQALQKTIKKYGAAAGSLIALDIHSGEVLAMVNHPTYNPNDRSKLKRSHLRNRAVTDLFEPGSTVKPFTVVAGLESGLYSPFSAIDTAPGYMRVGRKWIHDHRDYGLIDVTKVITKSSNVGSSKIALSLPEDTLPVLLSRFGFGQELEVGFPGESVGYVPGVELWRPIEIATLSYGYGMSTSLIHIAQAYATLGRYGVERPLSLVKGAEPNANIVSNVANAVSKNRLSKKVSDKQVIDSEHAQQVLMMMETVVSTDGTASKAAIKGYRIAGKTGTTHKLTSKGYAKDRYISLFAGIAPVSNPKWVVVVVVDDPSSKTYFGGEVAAPAFAEVMNSMFRLYGTPPDQPLFQLGQVNGGDFNTVEQ